MLFETRYFWAVFTARDNDYANEFRRIFESTRTAYASSISIHEVYRLTLEREG